MPGEFVVGLQSFKTLCRSTTESVTANFVCNDATVRRSASPISTAAARHNGPRPLTCNLDGTAPTRDSQSIMKIGRKVTKGVRRCRLMRADVSCCFEVGVQNRNRSEMNDRIGPGSRKLRPRLPSCGQSSWRVQTQLRFGNKPEEIEPKRCTC